MGRRVNQTERLSSYPATKNRFFTVHTYCMRRFLVYHGLRCWLVTHVLHQNAKVVAYLKTVGANLHFFPLDKDAKLFFPLILFPVADLPPYGLC